jgi:hypothetical protein
MGNCRLDLYFKDPSYVVSSSAGNVIAGVPTHQFAYTAGLNQAIVGSYSMRNLFLVCNYLESPTLMTKFAGGGLNYLFESNSWLPFQQLSLGAGGQLSLQIPTSYASVNHLFVRVRQQSDVQNVLVPNRQLMTSANTNGTIYPEATPTLYGLGLPSMQLLVNGRQRYLENLDTQGVLDELKKIHPEVAMGHFYCRRDDTRRNVLFTVLVGKDYTDGVHIAGYRTSTSVGGLTFQCTFTNAWPQPQIVETWLSYNRSIYIAPDGSTLISY